MPISRETAVLLADGLEQDIVQEFGWIFPEGRLDYDDARDKPWSKDAAIDRLTDAERVYGIAHVKGRAYHGVKRIHVTKSMEIAHGDTELVGDLTGNVSASLLRQTYRFGQNASKARHVDAIREVLKEPEKGGKSGMNLHVDLHVPECSHPHTLKRQGVMRVLKVGPDGFEPSPPVPKTGVLPLDDGP